MSQYIYIGHYRSSCYVRKNAGCIGQKWEFTETQCVKSRVEGKTDDQTMHL